jgi:ArsR family transcriptional regulator
MNKILSITKALSDGNRLRILMALWEHRELCACQITELLAVTGATVSRHLTVLSHAGLVESRKDGRWVNYRLREAPEHDLMFGWLKKTLSNTTQHEADRMALQSILAEDREDVCRKQRGEACCPSKSTKKP